MTKEEEQDRRLLAAARAAIAMFDGMTGAVPVSTHNELRFRVAWPCACHAIAQAKAALALLDGDMPFPADSNARSAFEHAMVAQWLLLTEGGEVAVADEARRQLRAQAMDVSTFIDLPDDLQPGHPVKSEGPAKYFTKLCDRFSSPTQDGRPGRREQTLYSIYRDLSGAVHPSTRTWQRYFTWDESGISGLEKAGHSGLGPDTALALALAVFLALDVIEELRMGQPRLAELRALATRHGVPCDLRGDDQEPQRQPQVVFEG